MKDFEEFVRQHPFSRQEVAECLEKNYDYCTTTKLPRYERFYAALMLTLVDVIDFRLKNYHMWLSECEVSSIDKEHVYFGQ